MKAYSIVLAPLFVLAVAGCSADDPGSLLGNQPPTGDPTAPPGPGPTTAPTDTPVELQCTEKPPGRSYRGFDGNALEASRINEGVGVNRARIKPYSVLAGELARVLGQAPPGLAAAAGSFDAPPARWYEEPAATGVGLSTLYSVVFEGALAYAKANAQYAAAPTAQSASAECTAFMKKAWNRAPSPNEVTECVGFATTKLGKETNAQRKWAYVLSSVLTSTGFLAY